MINKRAKNDVFRSYLVNGARFRGSMELPELPACNLIPESLTEFRRLKYPNVKSQFIHFYIPDRSFGSVFITPDKYLNLFKRFAGIIGFDFSVHAECPFYKQIEILAETGS